LNALAETLHLLSIPEMRESIQYGLKEDPPTLAKKLDWCPGSLSIKACPEGCEKALLHQG
jgi:hypothetical protein